MKYVMIRYRRCVTQRRWHTRKWHTVYHVDQARDRYSIAEAGSVAEEKERKEGNQTIFFTNDDADEVEATTDIKEPNKGEWSYSLKIWTKCRVLNSLVRDAGTNFGRQRLRHHCELVYAERMRRKSYQ